MEISCAFATSVETPEHVAVAEQLGYRRAWLYDSPALYCDVWVGLALAAQRTEAIGLGTGVLVPRLRHVLTTAAAAATVERLAPGRLTLGVGTGFTGSRALGQKAMKWADVEAYVTALRALLRGETVEWEGASVRLMHPDGFSAPAPVEIPIVIAAEGPKGLDVARRLGDGLFVVLIPPEEFAWAIRLVWGTILEDGEDPLSDRVFAAAGAAASVVYHGLFEMRGPDAVRELPGGDAWLERVASIPDAERHLAIHEAHLVHVSKLDRDILPRQLIPNLTLTGTREEVRARIEEVAASGVTELAYQPMGPDVPRELEAFMEAALPVAAG